MNILIAIGRKETITNAIGKAQETSILSVYTCSLPH
jgi:hypothetical protein